MQGYSWNSIVCPCDKTVKSLLPFQYQTVSLQHSFLIRKSVNKKTYQVFLLIPTIIVPQFKWNFINWNAHHITSHHFTILQDWFLCGNTQFRILIFDFTWFWHSAILSFFLWISALVSSAVFVTFSRWSLTSSYFFYWQ